MNRHSYLPLLATLLLLAVSAAAASHDVQRRDLFAANPFELRDVEAQIRAVPWHITLTVVTNTRAAAWCLDCTRFPAAVNASATALAGAVKSVKVSPEAVAALSTPRNGGGGAADDTEEDDALRALLLPDLVVYVVQVDCADFPLAAPCGEADGAFPLLRLDVREGFGKTASSHSYKGMNDAHAVVAWAAKRLPAGYVDKKFAEKHVPPTPSRQMLQTAVSALATLTPKQFEEHNKKGTQPLTVAALFGPACTKCAANIYALEAAARLLNASGIRNDSVLLVKMPFASVIVGKWIPAAAMTSLSAVGPVQEAQILVFLPKAFNNGKVHATPLLYSGPGTPEDLAKMVEYYTGKPLLAAAEPQGGDATGTPPPPPPAALSTISAQLRGLAKSLLGAAVNVMAAPEDTDAFDGQMARLHQLKVRHVAPLQFFSVLLVAQWVTPLSGIQREINQFLAFASTFDESANKDDVNASFSIVDVSAFSLAHDGPLRAALVGADITPGELCPTLPCVLQCRHHRDYPRTCGTNDHVFDRYARAIEATSLRRFASVYVFSTEEEKEVVFRQAAPTKALQLLERSTAVAQLDSLRPWQTLKSVDVPLMARLDEEGPATAASDVLQHRRHVLVLFHKTHGDLPQTDDLSRRAVELFHRVCRRLNSSTRPVVADDPRPDKGALVCGTVDAQTFPVLTARLAAKLDPAVAKKKEPFVVLFTKLGGVTDPSAAVELEDILQIPSRMQTRSVVHFDAARTLALDERAVTQAILEAVQPTHPLPPLRMATVAESTFEATVQDAAVAALVLFSGGPACPHSASVRAALQLVATYFAADKRQDVVIAEVDATSDLGMPLRKAYGIDRTPMLKWFPKGFAKGVGEVYTGAAHREALLEYVNDELQLPFFELDWEKTTMLPRLSAEEFEKHFVKEANKSNSVLVLYRDPTADKALLDQMFQLQKLFDAHPDLAPSNAEMLEHTRGASTGGVDFFRMDGRRFRKLLQRHRLQDLVEDPTQLPIVAYFPKGAYKLLKHQVYQPTGKRPAAIATGKQQGQTFDSIGVSNFILECVTNSKKGSMHAMTFFPKGSFSEAEVEAHRTASSSSSSGQGAAQDGGIDSVPELRVDNFRDFVDDFPDAIVYFYAPWCSQCKQFEPVWKTLVSHFAGDSTIKFGRLDVPRHAEIGHGQGIQSFPHLKMFFTGSKHRQQLIGHDYGNLVDNNASKIIDFIAQTRRSSRVQHLDRSRDLRERSLLDLNASSFKHFTENATDQLLVEFYAPWCGHCRSLVPELLGVAEHYRRIHRMNPVRPKVTVARLDGTIHTAIAASLNVSDSFPTIFLFANARTAKGDIKRTRHTFKDHRIADKLVTFMDLYMPKVGSHHTSVANAETAAKKQAEKTKLAQEKLQEKEDEKTKKKKKQEQQEAADSAQAKKKKDKTPPASTAGSKKTTHKERARKAGNDPEQAADHQAAMDRRKDPTTTARRPNRLDDASFNRDVRELTEATLQPMLDTTAIVLVLHYALPQDEEYVQMWNLVATAFNNFQESGAVIVSAIQESNSVLVRKVFGEAPSVSVIRGLATPQIARYKLVEEDDDEGRARSKFGEGGTGTNVSEVLEFLKVNALSALISSVELEARMFENVTQNASARVMVFLYAPWSAECRTLADSFDALAQINVHRTDTFITRVDISRATKLYERLHSKPVPMFLVYDPVPPTATANAAARRFPRYLSKTAGSLPTRDELQKFLLNEESEDMEQELLVPYGEEGDVPASFRSQQPSAFASASTLKHQKLLAEKVPVPSGGAALSVVVPLQLLSVEALQRAIATYTRGLLVFARTSWCTHCREHEGVYRAVANRFAATIAVAELTVAVTEEATALKKDFGITGYPAFALYLGAPSLRHVYTGKKKDAHKLALFVVQHIDFDNLDRVLPTYDVQQRKPVTATVQEAPATVVPAAASPTDTDATGGLVTTVTTPSQLTAILAEFQKENASMVGGVFLSTASWCSGSNCASVPTTALNAAVSLRKLSVATYLLDISSSAMKKVAMAELQVNSAPTVAAFCRNTSFKFRRPSAASSLEDSPSGLALPNQALSTLVLRFVEDQCFDLVSLDELRLKLRTLAEEVEIPEMSVDEVVRHSTTDQPVFALYYRPQRCDDCAELLQLWSQLATIADLRRLRFAKVDVTLQVNKEAGNAAAYTALPHLHYYAMSSVPVAYNGLRSKKDILAFIEEQHVKSKADRG